MGTVIPDEHDLSRLIAACLDPIRSDLAEIRAELASLRKPDNLLLSQREAARFLGISTRHFRRLWRRELIPPPVLHDRRTLRWCLRDLEALAMRDLHGREGSQATEMAVPGP